MISKQWKGGDSALRTYEAVAPFYDDFTRGYGYESECWTDRLLALAEAAGLEGNRLLDVGCGTGLTSLPMLERGWQVTACDLSPAMLEVARAKAGERARFLLADMRSLPCLGEFDLIWAVNEPLEIEGDEDSAHLHRVRHFPEDELLAAIEAAGLRCIGAFGELEKELLLGLDEEAHDNAVYLCRL